MTMDPKVEEALVNILTNREEPTVGGASGARQNSSLAMIDRMLADGSIDESDLAECTARVCGLKFQDVQGANLPTELAHMVPSALAARNRVIPIKFESGTLVVGASDKLPPQIIENLRRIARKNVELRIITRTAVDSGLKHLYGVGGGEAASGSGPVTGPVPPASQLLQHIMVSAMGENASDIHIEPQENRLRVRFRIDGVMSEFAFYPSGATNSLVSRVKILSSLDISEKRTPQDGAFKFTHQNESLDVRVSILPTVFGEKVVLRLLMSKSRALDLDGLGMDKEMLGRFEDVITRPHGIMLLTGPTGSGKSTTLYAAIRQIRSVSTNIITVEDPVEYQIDGVTQTQVDAANKVTFATALRAILRQDPDIIMLGEIRDRETSDIALRAALTGHMVFSTLHTNNAPGGVTRLIDMGCEPYLVASSVTSVIAQRLVRRVCPNCRQEFTPDIDMQKRLGVNGDLGAPRTWYRAVGCDKCFHTGYTGRVGLFEMLEVSDELRSMVVESVSTDVLYKQAVKEGMRTLRKCGLDKVDAGVTTAEEALRVTALD